MTLKKILTDKEGEISEAKGQLRQAKEDAVREYRDFNTLLKELGGSFADGFDDCFRQVNPLSLTWTFPIFPLMPRPRL